MAIKTFKDVIGNQGYRVDKKDREIFEREVRKGLFGNDGFYTMHLKMRYHKKHLMVN